MLWLCLSLPLLPVEIFTRAQSEDDRAVVITHKQRIVCCNTFAEESGIHPGMALATASALNNSLLTLERQPEKEQHTLKTLAHWCYQFTPAVSSSAPANILLDLQGSLKLFKGLSNLLQQLTDGLTEQGFSYRLGLAHTPRAASVMAATGIHQHGLPGYFDSQTQTLNIKELHHHLHQLPLSFLDCSAKELKSLHNMGFIVLGDLLQLPSQAVGKRLGKDFLHKLQQLAGARPDPRQAIQPPASFHSELHFLNGISNTDTLLFPIQRLLGELCQFMQARQVYCQTLRWQLSELRQTTDLTLNPSLQTTSKANLLELTRLQLEKIKLTDAVEHLALQARNFLPLTQQNTSLFPNLQEQQAEHQQAGTLLLDKLKIRLGEHQLHGIGLQDHHAPEQAWQAIPWEQLSFPGTATSRKTTPDLKTSKQKTQRPRWLLRQPMPLQKKDKALFWHGKLELLQGPERIDSQWWDKPVQRDYFIARHDNGTVYWIFRDLSSQQWFAHGIFG